MKNVLDIVDLFMMYKDVNRLLEKNKFDIKNTKKFKSFVISLYKIFSYSVYENNIYDVAEIYKEIYGEKIIDANILAPFKGILDIYNKSNIGDFKIVLKNALYINNIINCSNLDNTVKYYIKHLSKYCREYNMEEFSRLISCVCVSHYFHPIALKELERLDMLSLNTVTFLVDGGFNQDEFVIALNIISSLGLECNEYNLKLARSNILFMGKNRIEACKTYAQVHNSILYDDAMNEENMWEWFYSFIVCKNYIIVKCYNSLWGCKRQVFI